MLATSRRRSPRRRNHRGPELLEVAEGVADAGIKTDIEDSVSERQGRVNREGVGLAPPQGAKERRECQDKHEVRQLPRGQYIVAIQQGRGGKGEEPEPGQNN